MYIHLNKELCSNHDEIQNLLPKRRIGRRGREAGMGSEECSKRYLIDDENSNWEWPQIEINKDIMKKLMGAALEIAVRFFFQHFTYTFGGELFKQMFGGPIGARLTMCVSRLVLQQWRDDYAKIIEKAKIEELMSKIYVDDNRNVVRKLKPGMRFDEKKGEFCFEKFWEEEDKEEDPDKRTVREILKAMNSINKDLKFTVETEKDFKNERLPTLSFEIWSELEGIRHSYYEKDMPVKS